MAQLPSEILDAAAALIEPEGAWTQGAYARDRRGSPTRAGYPGAVCWCATGSISRAAANFASEQSAWEFLHKLVGIPTDFNDARTRTQPEVVAALRSAAELARRGGR